MKKVFWLPLVAAGILLGFGHLLGVRARSDRALAAPPLSLEGYMDEKLPEAGKKGDEILADNTACFVCHGNLEEEEMVVVHAREDVGCVDCHGPSNAHRDDEDNSTPPDVMFAPGDIGKKCAECHDDHNAPAREVIARWQARCPAKTNPEELVCTDCHGQHRLKFRTVWWDKKTRKLIVRKSGERTKRAADYTSLSAQGKNKK